MTSTEQTTTGPTTTGPVAHASGTFALGGDTPVHRLGFGTMRLTGEGIWGPPKDHDEAIRVLRRAVELGIDFIDTADSYGPYVAEELIREALHPYPEQVLIATKAGLLRTGPNAWPVHGHPAYLRQQVEMSLRRLGLERIDLFQLHRIDPEVPLADQLGELVALQDEGKIKHLGLSEVTVDELEEARTHATIVSVQNRYNAGFTDAEALLDHVTAANIAFIPWAPLGSGPLARTDGPLQAIARDHGASPSQLALAWLLKRSPVVLPIPGTSSVTHLEENTAAAAIELTDAEFETLAASF